MTKPTGRLYTFAIVAVLMYLAANQTQVNWLYVTSALIAGVIPAAWAINRAVLRGITGERGIVNENGRDDFHEGDTVHVTLRLESRPAAAQITLQEACPLRPIDAPPLRAFVPRVSAARPVEIPYTVTIDRRGLHTFPDVALSSKNPFGLFRVTGALNVPTRLLVYPEVRPLERLPLLDRQTAAMFTAQTAGIGNEVIGVRPYRAGDSPRHIHWRSVARTGQLVSKEFADETQPGLSLVIDRALAPGAHPKHNPFEWGIKAAVSIADYARQRRYPLYVHADASDFAHPHGAVTWDALMQYTARLPAGGAGGLADVLGRGGFRQFVAVMVAQPDAALVAPLIALRHSGANLLVVVPNPASFPGEAGDDAAAFVGSLRGAEVAVMVLAYGEDYAAALAGDAAQV